MSNGTFPTRILGKTRFEITSLGLGTWVMAGVGWQLSWGATEDTESVAAIRHAISKGLNWIDTAPAYGFGHAEELVGQSVRDISERERPRIFTKTGLVWLPGDDPMGPPRRILRPESIRAELEQSLRRLQVDHIDLYQVHWPDTGEYLRYTDTDQGQPGPNATPLEEYWQVMADLKAEGKVGAIGLSNHSTGQLDAAEAIAHVDAIQPPFSAVNRVAAPEIEWARQHGAGVIVYSPLQSGLLTGMFSEARARSLPEDDWRRSHTDFTRDLPANLALVEVFRAVAARHDVSVAEAALAWAVAWPGVTGAIVGARTSAQVDGWLGAQTLRLTEQDHTDIEAAIERTGAGRGPARPRSRPSTSSQPRHRPFDHTARHH